MLRLKGNPKGGPDGGDGGKGGDIVLNANAHIDTLVEFGFRPHWFAQDGEAGSGKKCAGKAGQDCILQVPLGTQIFDAETNELIVDITLPNQSVILAPGGHGGIGNKKSVSNLPVTAGVLINHINLPSASSKASESKPPCASPGAP